MNIQIQCCGLVVLLVLLIFLVSGKKVGLYTEKIFSMVLAVTIICVTLDIASIVAITYEKQLPQLLVTVACKSYLVSLVSVACSALIYVMTDLFSEHGHVKAMGCVMLGLLLEAVIICLLPIGIHHEESEIYTYGPSVVLTYAFTISYVIAIFVCMIIFRRRISPNRRNAVILWMTLWLCAAAVQFVNNSYLIVGFASAIGMMFLFFILENPESNIERFLGCFHAHALSEYMKQCFTKEENIAILLISMSGYQPQYISNDKIDDSIQRLVTFLDSYKEVKVFKNPEQELVAIFPDKSKMAVAFQQMQDYFYMDQFYGEDTYGVDFSFPRTLFLLIPECQIFKSTEEVIDFFQYVKMSQYDCRRTYVCYVNKQILEQMRIKDVRKTEILQALEEDRVEVFFQPIYSTKENKIISAEALARIRNTDGSIMPPGEFIPVAEECGLISGVGERVFEKVCKALKESDVLNLGIRYVEINLSVAQCEQKNLSERYIEIMEKYQINPWWINLEITETASVQTKNILLENMKRLMDYGVSFSLDDFGNGQSNLDYVIDMPVSIMKLDMNMTHAYFNDLKAQFVVQAAIRMGHDMDLMLVAEGVETKEQLDVMAEEGVDYIQGYYFSKPLPLDEFIVYLQTHQNGFIDK